MIAAFLKIFLLQALLIIIIVIVLKKVLDRQLVESAIRELEALDPQKIDASGEMIIVSYHALMHSDASRIQHALLKKTRRAPLLKIEQDKSLKGGIVMKGMAVTIDHSLKKRLQESGLAKS